MESTIEEFEQMFFENMKKSLELADDLVRLYGSQRDRHKQNEWVVIKHDVITILGKLGDKDGSEDRGKRR